MSRTKYVREGLNMSTTAITPGGPVVSTKFFCRRDVHVAEILLRALGDLVAVALAIPARTKNHEPVPLERHVRGVNAGGIRVPLLADHRLAHRVEIFLSSVDLEMISL